MPILASTSYFAEIYPHSGFSQGMNLLVTGMSLGSFCADAQMHWIQKIAARKIFFIFAWGWKSGYSNLMPIVGIGQSILGCSEYWRLILHR